MAQLRGWWLPCSSQQQQEASKVERLLGEEGEEGEVLPSLGEAAEAAVEEEAWSIVVLLILFRSVRSPDALGFERLGLHQHIRQRFLRLNYNDAGQNSLIDVQRVWESLEDRRHSPG